MERARRMATADKPIDMAAFFGALAKAQGEFKSIVKDKKGHGFKYADIGDVLEMALPILSKHGLGVMQPFTDTEMVTIIFHESGASREFRVPMVMDATARMNAAQKVGAGVTYFRRYHLCSVLGIATEDEMDARLRDSGAPSEDFSDAREPGLTVGVRGVSVPQGTPPDKAARLYADGITAQMIDAKTPKGLDGVWSRNEKVIARLLASYPAEHGDVLAVYELRQRQFAEGDAAVSE